MDVIARTALPLMVIAAFAPACARTEPAPVVPAAQACAVTAVGSVERPWRQVAGAGFTFCVPPTWRTIGTDPATAYRWTEREDTVEWAPGSLPPSTVRMAVVRVQVARAEAMRAMSSTRVRCSEPVLYREQIDNRPAELERIDCTNRHLTSAQWRGMGLHFTGSAASSHGAGVALSIYRTVRFGGSPQP